MESIFSGRSQMHETVRFFQMRLIQWVPTLLQNFASYLAWEQFCGVHYLQLDQNKYKTTQYQIIAITNGKHNKNFKKIDLQKICKMGSYFIGILLYIYLSMAVL